MKKNKKKWIIVVVLVLVLLAVGAKRRHILFQFLCEACVLSLLGGLFGLVLSLGTIEAYSFFTDSIVSMNWEVGLYAIAFCVVIGVIFGLYPASKASKLSPIEALRSN